MQTYSERYDFFDRFRSFSSTAIDRGIGIGRFGVEKATFDFFKTSFFARGQRASKLVLKSIKEEEREGRGERERKRKRKKGTKWEKENIKDEEKRGRSDANGKIAARVRVRGRVDARDRG